MKKKRTFLHLLFLIALFSLLPLLHPKTVSAAGTVSYKIKGTIDYTKSYECLKDINTLRESKGLKPLKMDKRLLKYAVQRCAEITAALSHTRPNGKDMTSLNRSLISGENLASGYLTTELTFNAWRNSPGHYKNMTRADYKSAGLACFEYNGECYWVNLFSKKAAKAVTKSGTVKTTRKIQISKKYLKKKNLGTNLNRVSVGSNITLPVTLQGVKGQPNTGFIGNTLFTYKSSNPSVLAVTKSGLLKPLREGKANITIQLKADKKVRKSFKINVYGGGGSNIDKYSIVAE